MSEGFKKSHVPCPCGESSDAYCIRHDGTGWCFSCSNDKLKGKNIKMEAVEKQNVEKKIHSHRNISSHTFKHYNVLTEFVNGQPNEVGFIYDNDAVKIRNYNAKNFYAKGDMRNASLFGKKVFDPGSKKSITITEGEYDAMAVYEMLGGKTAVVSIKGSSSARADLEKSREYINSFEKIIICFDADEPGQKAAREVSSLFDFNKVYHVELEKYKDANDYIKNDAVKDFITSWENAKRYSPNNIISGFEDVKKALNSPKAKKVADYPFSTLQQNLGGLHKGEMILMKGLQGIGKTEMCRALIKESLDNSKVKMATIFLEEDERTTIEGVATYHIGAMVSTDEGLYTIDEVMKMYQDSVKGDDSRLFIHSHFLSDNEREIIDSIRFLVTVAGCEVVYLDNLTMLNNGREGDDERLRIDRTIRMLRNITNELQFCLVLVAHTNDDGTTRGSRLPDIVSNTVIQMLRRIPDVKLEFNVTKARRRGSTAGPAGYAEYNRDTYRLEEPNYDKLDKVAA